MKSTGIVRNLDTLGRITLPKELRTVMELEDQAALEIYVEDNKVILQKYEPADIFTGEKGNLIEYHGKQVSTKSIYEMAKLVGILK